MKTHSHEAHGAVHPVSDPPKHSEWVLLASVTPGAKANPGAEPFVLARHFTARFDAILECKIPAYWQVMHGGEYMGATHWAEVTAFDDIICDFAALKSAGVSQKSPNNWFGEN